MADEPDENDTFVSVDLFAPTQSSLGAPNPADDAFNNDSGTFSDIFGDDVPLGPDDLLPSTNNTENSLTDSASMRFNVNRQDSAFMWTLTNEPSPEAFRQPDHNDHSVDEVEDNLSIADANDMCASFDTTTLSNLQQHCNITDADPCSSQRHPASPSDMAPSPTPYITPARRRSSFSSEATPARPAPLCSDEKPPLPPNHSIASTPIPSGLDLLRRTSIADESDALQTSLSQDAVEESASDHRTIDEYVPPETRSESYDPRIEEASHGYSTCIVKNPFLNDNNTDGIPEEIIIISRVGEVGDEEKFALHELATSEDSPKSRLVQRLIETVNFHRKQLSYVKDSEVNLAGCMLNQQLRRYSDVAQERSYAMNALVDEVDTQQQRISELENENESLKANLENSESKNKQIEDYYSNFVGDFNLAGDVVPALEKVNQGVDLFRRESIEASEQKDGQLDDYARRLLQMEDIVSDSRKRMQRVEAENAELRSAKAGDNDDEQENREVIQSTPPYIHNTRFISPAKNDEDENGALHRTIEELHVEVDNLRTLHKKVEDDRTKLQQVFLSQNVDIEEIRSMARTLQIQRDTAEGRCREIIATTSAEKRKFMKLSNEMSKNIVQVVSELDQRESDLRLMKNKLEDRESAFRSLQCTNQDIEDQLQAFTEAALVRNRSKSGSSDGNSSQPLVNAVIESLQKEVEKAQMLLEDRANDIDHVKKALQAQEESNIALQKECSRLKASVAVRRRSESVSSPSPSGSGSLSEEDRFLRRLSEKLGCKSSNNRELVEQLAKRVEVLMVDRSEVQLHNEKMRTELTERERALHKLRSEMQADISALRAENAHLENLKSRAVDDLKISESRLIQVLTDGDLSRRESLGEMTVSSVGTRAWLMGDESDIVSRRGSMLSSVAGDDTIRWSDPIIDAAVQSVSTLIGTKDTLAARNRELREKLQNLIDGLSNKDDDGSVRAVIIQSKELQDELTGVVGLQQDIIERLANSHSNTTHVTQNMAAEGALPLICATQGGNDTAGVNNENAFSTIQPLGEATRFLNEQLSSARALYSEKMRANADLCGTVESLQEELHHFKTNNVNVESALTKLKETHDGFLQRLAEMTGSEKSIVSLEDFIRASLRDMLTMQSELERKEMEERLSSKRLLTLVVQKRVLSHVIGLYQFKYRLNIMASSGEEMSNVRRRVRIGVFVVIAARKLAMLAKMRKDTRTPSIEDYDMPEEIDITQVGNGEVSLMEATLAIAAIPRMEQALTEKDAEIHQLEASIEALNRSAATRSERTLSMMGEMPRSSYVYEEDLVDRKNDLSRRLQKIIHEKEELEERISREKQSRLAAESKVARYMEKVAVYKKRLGKVSAQAQSKESAYKAAIQYLKNKADKAISNDFNMDNENVAPLEESQVADDGGENIMREPNASTRALLTRNLMSAEAELVDLENGSAKYEHVKNYVSGLRLTIQRLEKSSTLARHTPSGSSNRVALQH